MEHIVFEAQLCSEGTVVKERYVFDILIIVTIPKDSRLSQDKIQYIRRPLVGHQAVRESFLSNISYNSSKLSKLSICDLTIPSKLSSLQFQYVILHPL